MGVLPILHIGLTRYTGEKKPSLYLNKQETTGIITFMTKILIADDNVEFRQRVKVLLGTTPEFTLVGEAGDGYEAISKTIELKPDVVIMDVKMGDMNGLRATQQLKEKLPEVQVIILSRFDYQEYREAAAARGASAYVVKKKIIEDLLPAIRQVIEDQEKRTKKVDILNTE